ncbi:MAG: site-2 protease family protein [Clostridia bacterium]|nr:site-2 protease family protein [Clostridia bacterium]MBQ1966326.1 site-2 protease family protein [Clostridia bacterium]MBQ5742817.1 site-2 protease family protein [Clostridia bacterium]
MDIFLRILYTVLVLGVLIFVHELGHFLAAKACGVRVTEFALGMGPALFKKQGKETLYALRLFPIGGYCAMTGEDEEVADDPKAMRNKPVWMRMIIVLAGSVMNFLLGLTLVAVIVCFSVIPSTTVAEFKENATSLQSGLQVDDKIVAVQGIRVSDYTGMATQLSRCYNQDTLSLTVERNGQEIILQNVTFPTEQVDEGLSYPTADFLVYRAKKTPGVVIKQIFLQTGSYVAGVINSLSDMITGRISLKYVSGPVGISSVISEAASYGFLSLLSVAALISVNLGVMNILPLPALDGGRFLCLFIEAIIRRPIPAKVEGIIHAAGLLILLAIMVLVAFKDLFFPI